jgi:hypothetical protein
LLRKDAVSLCHRAEIGILRGILSSVESPKVRTKRVKTASKKKDDEEEGRVVFGEIAHIWWL